MIIVGGGLSGLMTAWRSLDINPQLSVMIIDSADHIGGDHTWSFNETDIAPELRDWLQPFIAYSWDSYDVAFPNLRRTLNIRYCTGNSDSLRACILPHIKTGKLVTRLSETVISLTSKSVSLESGETLRAPIIVDARGFTPPADKVLGYQKFVGQTIRTAKPHGLSRPVIMDATVDQLGGYRFVYCLPFTDHDILVEDTYYTDGADLSENEVTARLADYIEAKGWGDHSLVRKEKGVLPITLAARYPKDRTAVIDPAEPITIGIRGGYYHAITGYSLPEAVKGADLMAELIRDAAGDYAKEPHAEMAQHKLDHLNEERFARFLNRMLFKAAAPEKRYKILERFYGLSEPLIERFYAGKTSKADKIRILAGKPPVPITNALKVMSEAKFLDKHLPVKHSDESNPAA